MRLLILRCALAWRFPVLFFIFQLNCFGVLEAQRNFGVIFDENAYRDIPLIEPAIGIKGADFPKKLSLRPFCPTPGFQRETNACTAFAVGYGAMTIRAAVENQVTDSLTLDKMAFSAAFVYNQLKKNSAVCTEGISVEDALRFLKDKGNCRYAEFDALASCDAKPDSALLYAASHNQILDYAAVLPPGAENAQTVSTLINFLRDSIPVIVVFRACENFVFPPEGERVWSRLQDEPEVSLHCLLVTGYDEEARTMEVMSSWGTAWGDHGFYQVDWNDMGAATRAAYILMPNKANLGSIIPQNGAASPAAPTLGAFTLEGKVALIRVAPDGTPGPPEAVQRDPATGFYKPSFGVFPVNAYYQLCLSGTPGGKYIYVFSCDAKGKLEIHYPKPHFSALSPGRHTLTTIPSPESALRLSLPGDDLVCILYSQREISDISARIRTLKDIQPLNFAQKLQEAFDDVLLRPEAGYKIEYKNSRMDLEAKVLGGTGVALPVVLWLKAA